VDWGKSQRVKFIASDTNHNIGKEDFLKTKSKGIFLVSLTGTSPWSSRKMVGGVNHLLKRGGKRLYLGPPLL